MVINYDETYFRFNEFLNALMLTQRGRGNSKDAETIWNYTIEMAFKILMRMKVTNMKPYKTVYLCAQAIERRRNYERNDNWSI